MRKLLLSTAIILATGFGAQAQDATPTATQDAAATAAMDAQSVNVPGFRASEFIGMQLYTLDPDRVSELRAAQPVAPGADPRVARWSSGPAFVSARDQWEDIGKINDIVLSQDGNVRGVLLDIGGFLGIGARTVMVPIDELYFVADDDQAQAEAESISDFFVVAGMSRDQLEALPEWSDDVLTTGFAMESREAEPRSSEVDAVVVTDTVVMDDAVSPAEPTVDDLTGATVKDPAGDDVGSVEDLVMDGDIITAALIDVGGFLGIGTHRVAVPIEALNIVRKDDGVEVDHVVIDMTKEQLEALPAHE